MEPARRASGCVNIPVPGDSDSSPSAFWKASSNMQQDNVQFDCRAMRPSVPSPLPFTSVYHAPYGYSPYSWGQQSSRDTTPSDLSDPRRYQVCICVFDYRCIYITPFW